MLFILINEMTIIISSGTNRAQLCSDSFPCFLGTELYIFRHGTYYQFNRFFYSVKPKSY